MQHHHIEPRPEQALCCVCGIAISVKPGADIDIPVICEACRENSTNKHFLAALRSAADGEGSEL